MNQSGHDQAEACPRAAPLADRPFDRILLIKPSSLGDIVHALPVLHGLRYRYPKARIDWLAGTSFAGLIQGHPDLDEVIPFDRKRYGRLLRSPRVARDFVRFLADLRRRHYDLVVDLQGLFRSGFMSLATGAPIRIGFAGAREFAWAAYTHRLRPDHTQTHAVDRSYLVAPLLGFEDVPVTFRLPISDDQRIRAGTLLEQHGLKPAAPFVGILPGARWDTKRWPVERFAKVVDSLATDHGLPVVLLAGPDEADVCRRIGALCGSKPADLGGRTQLSDLVAILDRASVVICHDSAPMHLAAALNRPVVSILGPTNPKRTGPYSPTAKILQADLPCVPCYLRRLSQCRHGHACMEAIQPSDVVKAALNAIRGTS